MTHEKFEIIWKGKTDLLDKIADAIADEWSARPGWHLHCAAAVITVLEGAGIDLRQASPGIKGETVSAAPLQSNLGAYAYTTSLIESLIRRDSRISDSRLDQIAQTSDPREYTSVLDPNSALAILAARAYLQHGLALMMISAGCENPASFAAKVLAKDSDDRE